MTAANRPVPRATYRLQFNKDFTFASAAALAPYLGRLGISHAYLSPILKARPGSTHGYDTVDHTVLNPEIGTLEDFRRMAHALRAEGISIILDIVPNHMGIGGSENPLWLDVLERGQESRYAEWFDIDWTPPEPTLKGKVLVPFLGRPIGKALTDGGLPLRFDAADGSLAVWAEGTHKLPLARSSYPLVLGAEGEHLATIDQRLGWLNSAEGASELLSIVAAQHWRPAHFLVAADEINYRRFFIVSDLAAIRVERDDVFEHAHRLIFELVAEGLVDGLRIDHIDGLYDPKAYLERLRAKCPRPVYLIVEKILAPHETLATSWPIEGTTGYEFAVAATRLLVDPASEPSLSAGYADYTGRDVPFPQIEYDAKLEIIDNEMSAELESLAGRMRTIAAADPATADFSRNTLRRAIREVVANFAVYRTYVARGASASDRRMVAVATAHSRRRLPQLNPAVFDFVAAVLSDDAGGDGALILDAAARFQQYSGPVMAKGLEDTALYRYNRLLALADVGGKPDRFALSVGAWHAANRLRQQRFPHSMLASSTHDTKRGEDTRARIAALSGDPNAFVAAVGRWTAMLVAAGAPEIDPNDRWAFFQLLIGAWPAGLETDNGDALVAFRERVEGAMQKAAREAREHTSWTRPDTSYEDALQATVRTAFADAVFLTDFAAFAARIGRAGAENGLLQVVLKLTVPGVPDIYQGAELWEQSMVDPDNRLPVDFDQRRDLIERIAGEPDLLPLLANWRDGRVKLAAVTRLLAVRSERPALFADGSYEPLLAEGPDSERVIAFVRRTGADVLVVVAARFPWQGRSESALRLPSDLSGRRLRSILRGTTITVTGTVAAGDLLDGMPVTVLAA